MSDTHYSKGFAEGTRTERRRWLIGIATYFGIPFAIWIFTFLSLIFFDAPLNPVDGIWLFIHDLNRQALVVLRGPFELFDLFRLFAGTASIAIFLFIFTFGAFLVIRDMIRRIMPSRRNSSQDLKDVETQNRTDAKH